MKNQLNQVLFALSLVTMIACQHSPQENQETSQIKTDTSKQELIKRGKYLTTIGGCNDCHSPKIMTPMGPDIDTTRTLSGHPQDEKLPANPVNPEWFMANMDFTAFVGPWGISYAANLTPDDTGIGNWKFEQFVTALRKGKYKGLESSRNLLPPMPWQMYQHFTDEDLKAVFTYLKSLPPIENHVPAPVSPDKLRALQVKTNS